MKWINLIFFLDSDRGQTDSVINALPNQSYGNLNCCGLTLVSTNQHYQATTYQGDLQVDLVRVISQMPDNPPRHTLLSFSALNLKNVSNVKQTLRHSFLQFIFQIEVRKSNLFLLIILF